LNEKGDGAVYHSGGSQDGSKRIDGCPFAPRRQSCREKCVIFLIDLKAVASGRFSAGLRIQLGAIALAPGAGPEAISK
jgi:hypothetical protein